MYAYSGSGTVVKHKSNSHLTMIVTGRNNDHNGYDDVIKCKYWDEENGTFIEKDFFDFELEQTGIKNDNLRIQFMPGDVVKFIASPNFNMVIVTTNNAGVSYTCSFWNPVKLEFQQEVFLKYEIEKV